MTAGGSIIGVGMTPMNRRDLGPEVLARMAVSEALAEAGIEGREVALVVVGNAMGGRLCDQGCIRGQAWLREVGFEGAGVVNVDNSCAGASSALHLGLAAAVAGESPALVVGVEKMWTGDRRATLDGIEDGLCAGERLGLRAGLASPTGSILMGLNAGWVRHQVGVRGTTREDIAATVVKARRMGALNPLAQWQSEVTVEEVLESPIVADPLTRLMCSSFTDGAAAAVVTADERPGAPRVLASVVRSGDGSLGYHDRLTKVAGEAWMLAGVSTADLDVIEVHDVTGAEELYALESLGLFGPGEAGAATEAGKTYPGGGALCVNPSGGLLARGHPIGATGLCQVVELVHQMRGTAGRRQAPGARLGAAVNTGGIIGGDAATVGVHVIAAS